MSVIGYPIDKEDREYLNGLSGDSQVLAMRGTFEEVRLDPREIIKTENQSQQGACAGHSLSSVGEWCYAIATGGERIQLSRAMMYYEAQREDSIRSDSGSTIAGGVKVATTIGMCRESLWEYPPRYDNRRPADWDAVLADAANYKIGTAVRITSYDAYRTFLGAGLGGIHQGISWGNGMNGKVIERFSAGGGGHSICALCLSERVDSDGRPYAWIQNSWSESFGVKGWMEWSPTAIEQMLRHPHTVFVGLSDMPNIAPRKFNVDDWRSALRA